MTILVWLGFLVGSNTFAVEVMGGQEIGNGGNAVLCVGAPPELLDLYEARVLYGLTLTEFEAADPFVKASESISRLQHIDPDYYIHLKNVLVQVRGAVNFVPEGTVLTPLPDSFPVALPEHCTLGQLANYSDERGVLYIDRSLWDHLTPLNQSALILHETVYKVERESNLAKNSILARKIVAYLSSDQPLTWKAWHEIRSGQ